jgi:hypothetical protein
MEDIRARVAQAYAQELLEVRAEAFPRSLIFLSSCQRASVVQVYAVGFGFSRVRGFF